MKKGEPNILTVDRPVLFGVTSGSTGEPKFIPVTKYSRSKKTDVMDLWIYYMSRDHPEVFDGKVLAIVSPEVQGYTPSGTPYGAETGHGYRNLPDVVKSLYVLPYPVFQIEDYNARYYTILRIAMEHNVTTVATLNPSTIILLCQRINRVRGIENLGISENIITSLESHCIVSARDHGMLYLYLTVGWACSY